MGYTLFGKVLFVPLVQLNTGGGRYDEHRNDEEKGVSRTVVNTMQTQSLCSLLCPGRLAAEFRGTKFRKSSPIFDVSAFGRRLSARVGKEF